VYAGPPTCIRNDWYKTQNCQKFNGQTAKVTGPSRILKLLVSGQEGDLNGPACMHATHYACAHAHANTHKHEGVIISQSSEDIISENKRAYKNGKRNASSTHWLVLLATLLEDITTSGTWIKGRAHMDQGRALPLSQPPRRLKLPPIQLESSREKTK
jgi:hypothetical protein